ncbi:MAG: hypothetical protein ACJ77D_07125 [Chloroflexota bacterium]
MATSSLRAERTRDRRLGKDPGEVTVAPTHAIALGPVTRIRLENQRGPLEVADGDRWPADRIGKEERTRDGGERDRSRAHGQRV